MTTYEEVLDHILKICPVWEETFAAGPGMVVSANDAAFAATQLMQTPRPLDLAGPLRAILGTRTYAAASLRRTGETITLTFKEAAS